MASLEGSTPESRRDYSGLRFGGISPNVIRELSGIFPTFSSALKELISNAFDADSTEVHVTFDPGLRTMTVEDNGCGMTLDEFQRSYLRLGGSNHIDPTQTTPRGRKPIGRKGIGFLAIARFARSVEIRTRSLAPIRIVSSVRLDGAASRKIPGRHLLSSLPYSDVLGSATRVREVRINGKRIGVPSYIADHRGLQLRGKSTNGTRDKELRVVSLVDSRKLELQAVINYEQLLGLADSRNLDALDDFCLVRVLPAQELLAPSFTRVTIHLNDFVMAEFASPKRRGRIRNVASEGGLDQFLWHFARSIPVGYDTPHPTLEQLGLRFLRAPISPLPLEVIFSTSGLPAKALKRPFLGGIHNWSPDAQGFLRMPVAIRRGGLLARGYILGFPEPVFPAELRGITVRVRGVEIGKPSFFGVESALPGQLRPLLTQVVGEIMVANGLDAVLSVMPGREGFYQEDSRFKVLRQVLIGDGSTEFGVLGAMLAELWGWRSTRGTVQGIVAEAAHRKQALVEIASAVATLSLGSQYASGLRRLFRRSDVKATALADMPGYRFRVLKTVGEFAVSPGHSDRGSYEVDLGHKTVRMPDVFGAGMWSIHILGRDFRVSLVRGGPTKAMCEIDLANGIIFLNWLHPARARMGDPMFIKSVVGWRIAYLASEGNIDAMMSIAHDLISMVSRE